MGKLLESVRNWRRPKQIDLEDYLQKLKSRGLAPDGRQVPDPVPMQPPIGFKKQPSMVEIVRDMVRSEKLRQEALATGHETFEEAEDFDIGDEPDQLTSGWENDFDPPLTEILAEGQKVVSEREKSAGGVGGAPPTPSPEPAPPEPAPSKAT